MDPVLEQVPLAAPLNTPNQVPGIPGQNQLSQQQLAIQLQHQLHLQNQITQYAQAQAYHAYLQGFYPLHQYAGFPASMQATSQTINPREVVVNVNAELAANAQATATNIDITNRERKARKLARFAMTLGGILASCVAVASGLKSFKSPKRTNKPEIFLGNTRIFTSRSQTTGKAEL